MSDINTLEGEWQDLAIDNGDIALQANEYYAEITDGTDTLSTKITNISYSPSANKAKNITIDVPPEAVLESNKYLGETLRVYVNKKLLFEGNIVVIETSRNAGDDYSIEAEPPGKRLKGDDIDSTVSNKPVYDVISEVIDKYNNYDSSHSELRESDRELLTNVEHLGLDVLEGPGEARYFDVDAPETVYVKAYTPSTSSIDVDIAGVTESFDSLDANKYGEWVEIDTSSIASGQHDLIFTLNESSRLLDWIAIIDHEIKRTTYTPEFDSDTSESNFYSRTSDELPPLANRIDDGITVIDTEDKKEIRPRKVSNWFNVDFFYTGIGDLQDVYDNQDINEAKRGTVNGTGLATEGRELQLQPGEQTPDIAHLFDDIRDEEPLREYGLNIRCRVFEDYEDYDDDDQTQIYEDTDFWEVTFEINDQVNDVLSVGRELVGTDTSFDGEEYGWYSQDGPFFNDLKSLDTFVIKNRKGTGVGVAIDCIVLTHRQYKSIPDDPVLDYTFDNELNGNLQLDSPVEYAYNGLYSENQYVEFQSKISDKNISTATSSATFSTQTDLLGSYGIEQSIDITPESSYIKEINNNTSISENFVYPGASHSVRISLSSSGNDADRTPTRGYDYQSLNGVSVDAAFNEFDIVSDEGLTDNRLSVINDLTNDSSAIFRFDGDRAKIFQIGLLKSNVSLYKESVSSKRDISETYRSCLVKGKNDVLSNRITSANTPSYVKKDKFIIDRDVESEEKANARARSFLQDHSDIEYSGSITTLPTMAPVGEMVDGSKFSHGQDMTIESVRYGKRRTSISLGFTENIASQLIESTREVHGVQKEGTSQGDTVPVGQDQFSVKGGDS